MSRIKETQNEKKTLQAVLTLSGLGEKESRLYTILLQEGVIPASVLITKSGLKKGNTYAVLHQLQEKNLVRTFMKDKKQYFQPEPPQNVLEMLQKRSEETKLATQYFEHILPDLSSLYKKSISKPVIKYFEGADGIKEVFNDVYGHPNESVYGCVTLGEVEKVFPQLLLKNLIPKRVKNKIIAKSFLSESTEASKFKENDTEQLRETVILGEEYPLPAEIDVYEDKVAMLSFERGDFMGLIIENKEIATSLRSIFKKLHDITYSDRQK